jgi:ubiquinone/menaquinone biosynthesis C-methylase UbiE
MYGDRAFEKLKSYSFATVLDIGSGSGKQTELFRAVGKTVTPIDIRTTGQDYMTTPVEKHDCAWCCHVLEHQPNVNAFLKKMSNDVVDGGIICITVPPMKNEVVGGHLSVWNAGLLIYNLVMAGIDCRAIKARSYGYNVSVIVRNNRFDLPDNLYSHENEIDVLRKYLPDCIQHNRSGVIKRFNW